MACRLGACALAVSVASPLPGQVLTALEFSFSNPGARSMGLGGAFVALADDATAAFANPAGLTQLSEPEVSIEGRAWSYSTYYTAGGRAVGTPTGLGIDTIDTPIRAESTADLTGLSFLSFVYPTGDWSMAVFRHQLLNFEMTQEIQGIFERGPVAGAYRGPIERGFFDFQIETLGLAAGYRVSDRLSLGLGISYFDPDAYFIGDEYRPAAEVAPGYFQPSTFSRELLSHHVRAEITEDDWGLTGGFLWGISPRFKVGGVYRQGPELNLEGLLTAGPVHPDLAEGADVFIGETPWDFPDVFGLGLSYRSRDGQWTGSFEWTRVEYSTIRESLDVRVAGEGSRLSDGDELHLGGEYALFAGTSVVALRLGVWHDPDHTVQNPSTLFLDAEHPAGSDELHFAAGLGIAFERLQLDLGLDLSDRIDTAAVSVIFSF